MKQSGFSLVELSIVLVILGLLAGGIMAGQSLIRASELRAVTTEFNDFQVAVSQFEDKYLALPGDMSNATTYWGVDPNGCPHHTNRVIKKETCNGNGNGVIGYAAGSVNTYNESFRFWQQLSDASLIKSAFTGVAGTASGYHSIPDQNVPSSRMSSGGWMVTHNPNPGELGNDGAGIYYNNMFFIGKARADFGPGDPLFTPGELWAIDKKMDDAKPRRGKMITGVANAGELSGCTDTTVITNLDANYNLANSAINCHITFPDAF
jgi:prepilin-type N-terminal cleavage/methylation domain-containing protein